MAAATTPARLCILCLLYLLTGQAEAVALPPPPSPPFALPSYAVSVLAGSGSAGSADGQGVAASFGSGGGFIGALCVDAASGKLVVMEQFASSVRLVTPSGAVTTVTQSSAWSAANAGGIYDAACDGVGHLLVAGINSPHGAGTVWSVDLSTGVITVFAGGGTASTMVDGAVGSATFNRPSGLAIGPDGAVYVADCNINAPAGASCSQPRALHG